MHKTASIILLLVGSILSEPSLSGEQASFDRSVGNIKGLHFEQHEQSVNAARKGAADRLAKLTASAGSHPCGPVTCYSHSGFSDNSDAETLGQGVVGFTDAARRSSASSSKYQSSSQHESSQSAVPVYSGASGSKSSYYSSSQRHSSSNYGSGQSANQLADSDAYKSRSNFEAKSGSTVVQPVHSTAYPMGQGLSQSSYSGANRHISTGHYSPQVDNSYSSRSSYAASASSVSEPVVPVYSANEQSSKYASSNRNENLQQYVPSNTYVFYGKPVPVYTYTPVSSGFDSSARFASVDNSLQVPVASPVHASSSHQSSSKQEESRYSSSAAQPVPVYGSSAERSSQASSEHRSATRYTPVYQPSYSNQLSTEQRASDYSAQRVVPVLPISSSSSRQEDRHEDYSRKGNTYIHYVPPASSSVSKYSSYDQSRSQYGSSYVPDLSTRGSSSVASSQDQRYASSYTPVVVQPVPSSSSSASRYAAQQSQQASRSSFSSPTHFESPYASTAFNQHQSFAGHDLSRIPITGDALGAQFGAGSLLAGRNDDLNELMSESERLAKAQAQNAYNGAVSGSSAIDTESRFGGENADSHSTLPGGFKRTKSWSSSSKWASGQKYGEDGKVKSYSSLSTAESERHNVNGKTTGYKAATTTLEDDGKVSTYSLHTP